MQLSLTTKIAAALVGLAAVSSGLYVVAGRGTDRSAPAAGTALETGMQAGQLDVSGQIEFWATRATNAPTDYLSRVQLAEAWLERARQSGDIAGYTNASGAIDEALAVNPTYLPARATQAAVRLALHDFSGARALSAEIVTADPGQLGALATLGDASLELGDYDAATEHYQTLRTAAGSSAAVTARRARLAFLRGSADEALELADTARRQAEQTRLVGRSLAWYRVQASQYARLSGAADRAQREIDAALKLDSRYHVALVEAARVAVARGRLTQARSLAQRAVDAVPEPIALGLLADLSEATGDDAAAAATADTVTFIADLGERQGQLYNRQLAVFLADHGIDAQRALTLARREVEVRKDVYGWDALAWTALAAGELSTATDAAERSLALGTPDPLLRFHAAMVLRAAGDRDRARTLLASVLATTPRFDARQAPAARAVLDELMTSPEVANR